MKSMNKQRAVYASALTLILAVTMGVSVYTASSGEEEMPENQVAESVEISEREEVQQDLIERNHSIEMAEVEEEQKPENKRTENKESSNDKSSLEEPEMEEPQAESSDIQEEPTAAVDAELTAEANLEANGIFFDPATDQLAWPVSGNVVMEYSQDQVVYDATLDQFRVNDSISISGAEAEDVYAAATGIVAEVGYTEELGNYVVLEHGNGFRTTYGQMQDTIALTVADRVDEGQIIGQLAEPVDASVALGDHLTFKVTLNGEPVDPLEYLEYEME